MSVDPARYRKKKGGTGHGPVMLNIRFRRRVRRGDPPPTERELLDVLLRTLTTNGVVPEPWEFAAIDWRNPARKASRGWTSGQIEDFDSFGPLLRDQIRHIRINLVRRDDPNHT